jgi:hypothetical protein
MKSFFNPESLALNISTLGPVGKNPLGRLLTPLLAVPLVFLSRQIYFYSKDMFYVPLIIAIVGIIWVVNFAFENTPLERTDQIVLPLIPGMAEALLHLPLSPRIIMSSFVIFWIINLGFDRLIDKITEDPPQHLPTEERRYDVDENDDGEEIQSYALPPNKQKTLYEVLMLPIGAGVITSFLIHAALIITRRL